MISHTGLELETIRFQGYHTGEPGHWNHYQQQAPQANIDAHTTFTPNIHHVNFFQPQIEFCHIQSLEEVICPHEETAQA